MLMIYGLSALLIFIFARCSDNKFSNLKNEDVIHSEMMGINHVLTGMVFQIKSFGDFLLIKHKKDGTFFTLIDLSDPKSNVVHTGIIGPGPGELYNPGAVMTDESSFSVLEGSTRRLITFYLDSIFENKDYIPGSNSITLADKPIINLTKIGELNYVSNEVSNKKRFSILDSLGQELFDFGGFPETAADLAGNPEYVNNVAYQVELTSNQVENRFAAGTRYGEYMTFIEIDLENMKAETIHDHIGELPSFDVKNINGSPNFSLNKSTIAGYLSIASDEDYVYGLFSGKSINERGEDAYRSNKVHLFDWDGNLIKILELDKEVLNITLADNSLFGICESEKGFDIAKFVLR